MLKSRHTTHKHTIFEYHMGSSSCSVTSWHCLTSFEINLWLLLLLMILLKIINNSGVITLTPSNNTNFCLLEYISVPCFHSHSIQVSTKKNILPTQANCVLHFLCCTNMLQKYRISKLCTTHKIHVSSISLTVFTQLFVQNLTITVNSSPLSVLGTPKSIVGMEMSA